MSWIIGVYKCNGDSKAPEHIKECSPSNTLFTFENKYLFLASGGIRDTCFYGRYDENNSGFIVSGIGFEDTVHGLKWMGTSQWKQLLDDRDPKTFDSVSGYYVSLHWNQEQIRIANDPLGLRSLYFTRNDNNDIIFSTRTDWLPRICKRSFDIDFEIFGSQWQLINKISRQCSIKNIVKLGPSSKITLQDADTDLTVLSDKNIYSPCPSDSSSTSLSEQLSKSTMLRISDPWKITVGLSGGLDSRTLLSFLLNQQKTPFETHVIGPPDHPDVKVACDIAEDYELPHHHYPDTIPTFSEQKSKIYNFAGQNGCCLPVWEADKWKPHQQMYEDQKILLDGGYAGIVRNRFMKLLKYHPLKQVNSVSSTDLFNNLYSPHAEIFNDKITRIIKSSTLPQIRSIWKQMQHEYPHSLAHALNLFMVNTHITNISSRTQACLDQNIPSWMPFINDQLLNFVFGLNERSNSGDRSFKRIIQEQAPGLTNHPIADENVTYPFAFSDLSAIAYRKFKQKFGTSYQHQLPHRFLNKNETFIRDLASSKKVKDYTPYDYQSIQFLINQYFNGSTNLAGALNQWLTFEIWRQTLSLDG